MQAYSRTLDHSTCFNVALRRISFVAADATEPRMVFVPSGSVAVVTGGGSGIGKALCCEIAAGRALWQPPAALIAPGAKREFKL